MGLGSEGMKRDTSLLNMLVRIGAKCRRPNSRMYKRLPSRRPQDPRTPENLGPLLNVTRAWFTIYEYNYTTGVLAFN